MVVEENRFGINRCYEASNTSLPRSTGTVGDHPPGGGEGEDGCGCGQADCWFQGFIKMNNFFVETDTNSLKFILLCCQQHRICDHYVEKRRS